MRWILATAVTTAWVAVVCLTAQERHNWSVHEEQAIPKAASLPNNGTSSVMVDNVDGYVHVTGASSPEVRLNAHETIRAASSEELERARREVTLKTETGPREVSVVYDAPWRCRNGSGPCEGGYRHSYEVTFDIDIQVPNFAQLTASTVNGRDVVVTGTSGGFKVRNVNGGISMREIEGAGEAETVNGPVTVRFRKNPSEACRFKSVNGELDMYFERGLSADLLFKTFNGGVYTDFDVTAHAMATMQAPERQGSRFVYRSAGFTSARAGGGGPRYSFETLNGNIKLHQQE